MSVPDFINFCKSNKNLFQISCNPANWMYLIKRDFDAVHLESDYHGDYRKLYFSILFDKIWVSQINQAHLISRNLDFGIRLQKSEFHYELCSAAKGKNIYKTKIWTLFGLRIGDALVNHVTNKVKVNNSNIISELCVLAEI